jgi:hypothetical protein
MHKETASHMILLRYTVWYHYYQVDPVWYQPNPRSNLFSIMTPILVHNMHWSCQYYFQTDSVEKIIKRAEHNFNGAIIQIRLREIFMKSEVNINCDSRQIQLRVILNFELSSYLLYEKSLKVVRQIRLLRWSFYNSTTRKHK